MPALFQRMNTNIVYKQNNAKDIIIKLNVLYNYTQTDQTQYLARNNYAIKYLAYFCWSKKFHFAWTTFSRAESRNSEIHRPGEQPSEHLPCACVRGGGVRLLCGTPCSEQLIESS